MTLGEVTAIIGMITARPEESGSDYATGHESTVGSLLELAVGLRQGQPSYPTEEDTNMGSAPWGYQFFERNRMVNQFGEAAARILIHEWTPETHDLATLPAQVGELTGALNYLQPFLSRRLPRFPKFARESKPSLVSLNSIRGEYK